MRHAPATSRLRRTGPSHTRRLAGTLVTLASLTVASLALSAAPTLADDCPNAALRAENNSARLPECRAYEMVTPLYKEGFTVYPGSASILGFTGDTVAYQFTGSIAGSASGQLVSAYVATRSAAGWGTGALNPPASTYNTVRNAVAAESADGRLSLWKMIRTDLPGDGFGFYLRGSDGAFTRIGDATAAAEGPTAHGSVVGESADFSHVVFAFGSGSPLYEWVGTGNEGTAPVVSVDNLGQPQGVCPNSLSPDARVIVYTTGCPVGAPQVWARVGGSASVLVSGSECTRTSGDPGGACNATAGAEYSGAAADGSRVFFTSTQQLLNGDTDQSNDLYACDIPPGAPAPVGTANPCASLTEVSGSASGANVENVVNVSEGGSLINVSEDGSRVYFVATGVLAANLGTNDATAVAGDHNLYVWEKDAAHPAGQTTFVAKLESNDLGFHPQTTADGRYLVFNTPNRLLPSDTDEAADVYRYDADTGALLRLSTDTSGAGGNAPGFNASLALPLQGHPHGAMSDDGSTIIFETGESLSPADTDGTNDVYEWHEGQVSLISNGGGTPLGITPSGRDIFFHTNQPLTAGDSGTEGDVYDARVEGGFPVTAPTPCSGEACQGAPTLAPQPPGTSASAAFNGPGSPLTAETPPATQPKPKPQTAAQKLAKALKACKAKHNKKKRKACEKRARNTYRRGK